MSMTNTDGYWRSAQEVQEYVVAQDYSPEAIHRNIAWFNGIKGFTPIPNLWGGTQDLLGLEVRSITFDLVQSILEHAIAYNVATERLFPFHLSARTRSAEHGRSQSYIAYDGELSDLLGEHTPQHTFLETEGKSSDDYDYDKEKFRERYPQYVFERLGAFNEWSYDQQREAKLQKELSRREEYGKGQIYTYGGHDLPEWQEENAPEISTDPLKRTLPLFTAPDKQLLLDAFLKGDVQVLAAAQAFSWERFTDAVARLNHSQGLFGLFDVVSSRSEQQSRYKRSTPSPYPNGVNYVGFPNVAIALHSLAKYYTERMETLTLEGTTELVESGRI